MKTEIQHAVTFLVETLKDKLPTTPDIQEKLYAMRTRLTDLLAERYENHWYADKPFKGSAYRCINISVEENSFDVALRTAANDCGLTEDVVRGVFLNGLALWVDPDDVSGRLGKGAIFPIYKKISENKAAISLDTSSHSLQSSTPQHRPQQRPRSISPPQSHVSYPDVAPPSRPITTTVSSRPSKTPPGFRSLDAGQSNFYNMQQQQQQQQQPQPQGQNAGQRSDFPSNIQKLWRNPTSHTRTTTGTMSHMNNTRHPTTYVPTTTKYNSTEDAVYSFNQYSSYYNPHFHWRKDNQTPSQSEAASASASQSASAVNKSASYVPLKSLWQDDESYQRTHWFADSTPKSNTNKLSVAGNNLTINKVQNYGYSISRQAQEVY